MALLVAYASEHGSTQQIAQRISQRLSESQIVECRPLDEVSSLSGFRAAIIGSAVHNQKWLPSASAWINLHKAELSTIPIVAFSVGAPHSAPSWVRSSLAETEELRLRDYTRQELGAKTHALFSGAFRKQDTSHILQAVLGCCGWKNNLSIVDSEWAKVDKWAIDVAPELSATQP